MQHDPEPLYPKAMAMPHLTMLVSERDHIHPHARHAAEAKERATPTHPHNGKTGENSQSNVENCKGAEKL